PAQMPAPAAPARPVIQVKSATLRPGVLCVRGSMCLARSKGDAYQAMEFAKQWKDTTPEVELWVKAAVLPGTTTDPAWAGALVTVQNITDEFCALLRPQTILGRTPGLREVAVNASVPTQTAGG